MVDLLTANLSDQNSHPVLDALTTQSLSHSFPSALSNCTTRYQLDDLVITFVRN